MIPIESDDVPKELTPKLFSIYLDRFQIAAGLRELEPDVDEPEYDMILFDGDASEFNDEVKDLIKTRLKVDLEDNPELKYRFTSLDGEETRELNAWAISDTIENQNTEAWYLLIWYQKDDNGVVKSVQISTYSETMIEILSETGELTLIEDK